jgi:hypothetical protein
MGDGYWCVKETMFDSIESCLPVIVAFALVNNLSGKSGFGSCVLSTMVKF